MTAACSRGICDAAYNGQQKPVRVPAGLHRRALRVWQKYAREPQVLPHTVPHRVTEGVGRVVRRVVLGAPHDVQVRVRAQPVNERASDGGDNLVRLHQHGKDGRGGSAACASSTLQRSLHTWP